MTSVYDFTVRQADGGTRSLRDYEGRPLLIVNTASKCGFTPQFQGLQQLHERYESEGLVVLGFPCDQFNNQEFDDIEETTSFCQVNYGVTFPIFAKVDVNGESADPLFAYLRKSKSGLLGDAIKWNFTKFLVGRDGQVLKRFAPQTSPGALEQDVQNAL